MPSCDNLNYDFGGMLDTSNSQPFQ